MNQQLRNQLITGINRMMEGLAMVGQALEADGWEQIEDEYALAGNRPVAAARLEEPSFQAELEERVEAEESGKPAEPVHEYTLEEVRAFLAELSQQGYTAQVRQLILDAGAKALSEVAPAKFGQIIAGLRRLPMPDRHALLSASSAHRWLHCPPSALAVDGVADAPSDAALQGTAAHALAEYKLLRFLKRRAKCPTSEWIDEEMEGHADDYVQFVAQHLESAREHCSDSQVYVERRLDYSHLAPGGFGTGDCVIVADFSAIEARVLAWLAGEIGTLQAFREGKDLCC